MQKSASCVLVIDSEPQNCRLIHAGFESENFVVIEADTGQLGVKSAAIHSPNLIIIDPNLPDMDGAAVVERIRGWLNVPIIILSARSNEEEKVRLLNAGADDYVVKPYGMAELLARAHSAVRRHAQVDAGKPVVSIGHLTVDFAQRLVLVSGNPVRLSRKEYKLIQILAANEGKTLTHRQLMINIWGEGHEDSVHYLRILVRKVRNLIELDPKNPTLLLTELSIGYKLVQGKK